MKKVLIIIFLLSQHIVNAQCPKFPQSINSYYDYWGLKNREILQLPRHSPLVSCRDSAMIYYNVGDSAIHWWTGFTDRSFLQYANSGLYNNSYTAQWGEPLGQSGNPSMLLHNSEIPFNGFSQWFYDSLNNSTTRSSVRLWDTTGALGKAPLKIIQNNPTGLFQILEPFNYGVAYTSAYRPGTGIMKAGRGTSGYTSAASLDAMPDNVYEIFGYNSSPGAGRSDTSDASARISFETNFLNTLEGSAQLNFEYHDPEITTFAGNPIRTHSLYINKIDGFCLEQDFINTHEYRSVFNPTVVYYAVKAETGGTVIASTTSDTTQFTGYQFKASNTQNNKYFAQYVQNGDMFFGNDARVFDVIFRRNGNISLNNDPNVVAGSYGSTVIGTDSAGFAPDPSALLDVRSRTKGFLPPRMTTVQKNALPNPAEGLIVYDLTLHKLSLYTGTVWETVTSL